MAPLPFFNNQHIKRVRRQQLPSICARCFPSSRWCKADLCLLVNISSPRNPFPPVTYMALKLTSYLLTEMEFFAKVIPLQKVQLLAVGLWRFYPSCHLLEGIMGVSCTSACDEATCDCRCLTHISHKQEETDEIVQWGLPGDWRQETA